MRLDVAQLQDPKNNLILSSSFDGLLEANKQTQMKLLVYSLNEKSSKTCADNYYLGLDDFYANDKLRKASFSGLTIRTHVEKMLKSVNQIQKIFGDEVFITSDQELVSALKLNGPVQPKPT